MDLDGFKEKVCAIEEQLAGGLSIDPLYLGDDWTSVADELGSDVRHIFRLAYRLAGYAGLARRKANESKVV